MENEEFRTVRVYTKKYTSKDKDGNSVEKESKQKQVSLKKEDPFEDNDLVKVIPKDEYEKLYSDDTSINKLIYLNKIYDHYNLCNQENKPMINILQFELEKTLPKFLKCLNVNELKETFTVLNNLIESNDANLRKATKSLLQAYLDLNLIVFNKYNSNQ